MPAISEMFKCWIPRFWQLSFNRGISNFLLDYPVPENFEMFKSWTSRFRQLPLNRGMSNFLFGICFWLTRSLRISKRSSLGFPDSRNFDSIGRSRFIYWALFLVKSVPGISELFKSWMPRFWQLSSNRGISNFLWITKSLRVLKCSSLGFPDSGNFR